MAKSKSGRITLRVKPEVHQNLAEVAEDLGLDVNGLLNLLIRRSLGEVAAEARVYRDYMKNTANRTMIPLLHAWEKANPARKRRDFLEEFRKYVLGDPNSLDDLNTEA